MFSECKCRKLAVSTHEGVRSTRRKLAILGLALVVGLVVLTACGHAAETQAGEADSRPSDPVGARDAVLGYLSRTNAGQAPAAGLAFVERHTKPEELLGGESYEYTAGDYVVTVSYPVVAPDMVVYTVAVTNAATGFRFEATVDAHMQVTETQPERP